MLMGIVIRQSFWASFLTYGGVALGYVSTLLLFPRYLHVEEIGLIRLIQSNALMLVPVASLGTNHTLVKFHSGLKDPKEFGSFLMLLLVLVVASNALIIGAAYTFENTLTDFFSEKSAHYASYLYASIVILVSQSIFETFAAYFRANLNISIPNFLKEVLLRLSIMTLIVVYGLSLLSFAELIMAISAAYILITLLAIFWALGKYPLPLSLKLKADWRKWKRKLLDFGGYSFSLGVSNSLIQNLGFLLTSTYLGLEANGIYTTCLYIAMVIEMPKRAISQIISPLYAQFFEDGNRASIRDLYKKSALNLYLLGILLSVGIVTNVQDLFSLIPKGSIFAQGETVIFWIAVSKVLSMAFGTSGELLIFSTYKTVQLIPGLCECRVAIDFEYNPNTNYGY